MSTAFQTTPERRANLVKLARFLYTEPIEPRRFNMRKFGPSCDAVALEPDCKTAGCAVGWGPNAGIEPRHEEGWCDYASRCLVGVRDSQGYTAPEFLWCFGDEWKEADNTPKGAAIRIIWMLVKGLPRRDDTLSMQWGDIPLCYDDWEPTEADWLAAERGSA